MVVIKFILHKTIINVFQLTKSNIDHTITDGIMHQKFFMVVRIFSARIFIIIIVIIIVPLLLIV